MDEDIDSAMEQENNEENRKVEEVYVEEHKTEKEEIGDNYVGNEKVLEENNKEREQLVDASIEDGSNKDEKVVEPSSEADAKDTSSTKMTPKRLMPKPKIVKIRKRLVKRKIARGSKEHQGNQGTKKELSEGSKGDNDIEKEIVTGLNTENNKEGEVAEVPIEENDDVGKASADGNGEVGSASEKETATELNTENNKEGGVADWPVEGNDEVGKASADGDGMEVMEFAGGSVEGDEKQANIVAEASAQGSASAEAKTLEKKAPNQLKAKAKIAKKRISRLVKKKIVKGTPKVMSNREENSKSVSKKDGSCTGEKIGGELQNNASNDEATEKMDKNLGNLTSTALAEGSKQNQTRKGRRAMWKKNKKGKLPAISENRQQDEDVNGSGTKEENLKKRDGLETIKESKKKEKLGGLIFMCNAKTKPDCFRFRVMGVSENKKDVVMGIRPGLKLFLYDYDLKLLYGIYQASSSGGMKLERKAFGGSFPAQVRFKVLADCNPIPESVFRKAIKENYNTKSKFKTELTLKQVSKLQNLFQPAPVPTSSLPVRTLPVSASHQRDRDRVKSNRDRYAHSSVSNPPVSASLERDRERSYRDRYAQSSHRIHYERVHERDRPMLSLHGESPHDLYLSEREYRVYGLRGVDRSQNHAIPRADHYRRDVERDEHLRHPDAAYEDSMRIRRDTIHTRPLYMTEREPLPLDLGARNEIPAPVPRSPANRHTAAPGLDTYARDPYRTYSYGVSAPETYLTPLRRERLYSTYAGGGPSEYYAVHHSDVTPQAVPSRYAIAGPPFSYR